MAIPETKIAEVAHAANIVDVISQYVELKRAGKDYRGVCPFHGDKDPSFFVSPQKGSFYCFGCAAGGSVFNFLMKIENMSFVDAVRTLADRYGVTIETDARRDQGLEERKALEQLIADASAFFAARLRAAPHALRYLRNRDMGDPWIQELALGFAPESWDALTLHLGRNGANLSLASSAGLVRRRTEGGHYDYFRSRIMIPIRNLQGTIVGFGGRILGEGEPKYLNSPESSLFSKRRLLFGLDSAREAVRREGFCLLVEGYFDQLSLRVRGIANAAAPLGTSLAREQIKLLTRFTSNIITVFDGDAAGVRAVTRVMPMFLSEGLEPRCVILTEDKDPDEAVRRVGADGFRKLVERAVPMTDFFLDSLAERHDPRSLAGRSQAMEECIPIIREIADHKAADYFIEKLSSRMRVREDRVRAALNSATPLSRATRKSEPTRGTWFSLPADERNVVRGMLMSESFFERVREAGAVKDIEHPLLKSMAEKMLAFREQHESWNATMFCASLADEELAATVAGWLHPRREEDDLREEVQGDIALEDSLRRIALRRLIRRKTEIQTLLGRLEPGADEYNRLAGELLAIGRSLRK
jgi:DNA primase